MTSTTPRSLLLQGDDDILAYTALAKAGMAGAGSPTIHRGHGASTGVMV